MTRWHWHCAVIVSDTIRGRNHDTNRSVRPSRAPLTGLRRMRITADQVRFLSGINTNRSPTERPGESRAAFLRDEIASEEMLQRYFSKPAPFTDRVLACLTRFGPITRDSSALSVKIDRNPHRDRARRGEIPRADARLERSVKRGVRRNNPLGSRVTFTATSALDFLISRSRLCDIAIHFYPILSQILGNPRETWTNHPR